MSTRGHARTLISSPDSKPVSMRTVSLVAGGRWCSKRPVSGRKPLEERDRAADQYMQALAEKALALHGGTHLRGFSA